MGIISRSSATNADDRDRLQLLLPATEQPQHILLVSSWLKPRTAPAHSVGRYLPQLTHASHKQALPEGMADIGAEPRDARQNELNYEARATQLRQRIEQLITSFAEIEAEAEDLRPTHTDDHLRLTELENRLRYNITALQQLSAPYEETVA